MPAAAERGLEGIHLAGPERNRAGGHGCPRDGRSRSRRQAALLPGFPDFYAGWLNLESRSGSGGTRVAYAGTNIPYYLLGAGLRNEVRYVNVDRPPGLADARLPPRRHGSRRANLAELEARLGPGPAGLTRPGWPTSSAEGIQLLVVTRVNPAEGPHNVADADRFPIERGWAESHPESFEPLYGVDERDPFFRLYRLRRAP